MKYILSFVILSLTACTHGPEKRDTSDPFLKKAREILKQTPLTDGHNDLPWTLRGQAKGGELSHHPLNNPKNRDTDIGRLRQGGVGGQFWSVYIPVGDEEAKQGYAKTQLEQIDLTLRMIRSNSQDFELALSSKDIEIAMGKKKVASLLGMEGGHAIENSLGALRSFYRLGVRYMTLTHWKNIDWADAATDKEALGGLSPFGIQVVKEMNGLGMMVDLSHTSAKVMHKVLDISEAPVIFSHSSARALVPHKRNVPDAVLKRMAANGGVVMVTFVTGFVSNATRLWWENKKGENPGATLQDVADHIEHVRKIAGIDHVGIGGDFYGQKEVPRGLEDVSKYPYLFAELLRRGWTEDDLKKLAQKNILRVFRRVEAVSQKLRP